MINLLKNEHSNTNILKKNYVSKYNKVAFHYTNNDAK